MAFTMKNCKYLKNVRLIKLTPVEFSKRNYSLYIRHSSSCLCLNHSHQRTQNTYSPHDKLQFSHLKFFPHSFGISYQRFISTENNGKYAEQLASFGNKPEGIGDAVHSGTAKVLFVDTPTLKDSASDIVDNAVVTDSLSKTSFDSSTVSEAVASSSVPQVSSDVISSTSVSDVLSVAAEPSLASLGLASNWTPVGIVQQLLEIMHINSYVPMPWWATIVVGTIVARILMFPIFILAQRNAARFSHVMPQLQALQMKFNAARRSGNSYEAMRAASEISTFMKNNNFNPVKNALMPMAQLPVFLSYFLALRNMANLPVESMKIGGFSWITDLTIPDPYYIMPLCACSTLYVVLKLGADSGVRMDNLKYARYFLKAMPVILFPFCMNFPSAVLFYWCTNNFLTLGLVLTLKIEKLRVYFGIPQVQKPPPSAFEQKGFVSGMKEAFEDQKALRNLDDRRRVDEMRFRKAGTGPIPRTYAYDPTKPRPAEAAAAAAAKMHSKTKS